MTRIDKCKVTGYTRLCVKKRNIVHKGLKRLYAEGNAKGVPPDTMDKLRKMLAFLDDMEAPEECVPFPHGKCIR